MTYTFGGFRCKNYFHNKDDNLSIPKYLYLYSIAVHGQDKLWDWFSAWVRIWGRAWVGNGLGFGWHGLGFRIGNELGFG